MGSKGFCDFVNDILSSLHLVSLNRVPFFMSGSVFLPELKCLYMTLKILIEALLITSFLITENNAVIRKLLLLWPGFVSKPNLTLIVTFFSFCTLLSLFFLLNQNN